MQFSTLSGKIEPAPPQDGAERVTIPKALFLHVLIAALRQKGDFDPNFYIATYPDIRQAVQDGTLLDPADHYYGTGYLENRQPRRFIIDERYYLSENPDVAEAMRDGKVTSPHAHFDTVGFREGRAPFAGFSLF